MRVRSRIFRWGLLLTLTLGVVLMHHTPGTHDATSPPAHTHAVSAASITATAEGACECHTPMDHFGALFSSGHGALHLCLAILIGFAVTSLVTLGRGPDATAPGLKRGLAPPGGPRRPPIPVARRLAVLCVMRC